MYISFPQDAHNSMEEVWYINIFLKKHNVEEY